MKYILLLPLFLLSCMSSAMLPTATPTAQPSPPTATASALPLLAVINPPVIGRTAPAEVSRTMKVCPDTGALYVRASGSKSALVVDVLGEGKEVTAYETLNGWTRVRNGWVKARYLCL